MLLSLRPNKQHKQNKFGSYRTLPGRDDDGRRPSFGRPLGAHGRAGCDLVFELFRSQHLGSAKPAWVGTRITLSAPHANFSTAAMRIPLPRRVTCDGVQSAAGLPMSAMPPIATENKSRTGPAMVLGSPLVRFAASHWRASSDLCRGTRAWLSVIPLCASGTPANELCD